jgi:hypothetical protein
MVLFGLGGLLCVLAALAMMWRGFWDAVWLPIAGLAVCAWPVLSARKEIRAERTGTERTSISTVSVFLGVGIILFLAWAIKTQMSYVRAQRRTGSGPTAPR